MKQAIKTLVHSAGLDDTIGRFLFVAREMMYDLRHGTTTRGNVRLQDLKIASPNVAYGWYYEGIDPKIFARIMNELRIEHERFEFVDFGAGKGRVLLLASDYPFRKITGVEFSAELAGIAQKNLRQYRSATQRCRNLDVACADAMQYPIPSGPVVLFFNNPFGEEVMAPVLAGIAASAEAEPREVYIVYTHPRNEHLLAGNAAFRKVVDGPWYVVYRCEGGR